MNFTHLQTLKNHRWNVKVGTLRLKERQTNIIT